MMLDEKKILQSISWFILGYFIDIKHFFIFLNPPLQDIFLLPEGNVVRSRDKPTWRTITIDNSNKAVQV